MSFISLLVCGVIVILLLVCTFAILAVGKEPESEIKISREYAALCNIKKGGQISDVKTK